MVCLDQSKLLYIFPIIALNFGGKFPSFIDPVATISILYILTFIYSRLMVCNCNSTLACSRKPQKDIWINSLAGISIFIPLAILMYIAMFAKLPIIQGANMFLNNMIIWGVLGIAYKKIVEKAILK